MTVHRLESVIGSPQDHGCTTYVREGDLLGHPAPGPATLARMAPAGLPELAEGAPGAAPDDPRRLVQLAEAAERAHDYAGRSKSPATIKVYAAGWRDFLAFCESRGLSALLCWALVAGGAGDECGRGGGERAGDHVSNGPSLGRYGQKIHPRGEPFPR